MTATNECTYRPRFTSDDLRKAIPYLKVALGDYWEIVVCEADEECGTEGFLLAECVLGLFTLSADGEWLLGTSMNPLDEIASGKMPEDAWFVELSVELSQTLRCQAITNTLSRKRLE